MVTVHIRDAVIPDDLDVTRTLFRGYAASLTTDLCFQNFQAELAGLPGKYAPPQGRLLLAWSGGEPVGCIAMRPLEGGDCEMKRLWVRPHMRGASLGRRLVERICQEARAAGYARICLDTLPNMSEAIRLYTAMGFQPIEPYVYNPVPGALYLALPL
jgi:ribosomal protein S18 acetylase RimI-like enzyme